LSQEGKSRLKNNELEADTKKLFAYLEKHDFDLNYIYLNVIVEEITNSLNKIGFQEQISDFVLVDLYPKNIFSGISKKTDNGFLVLISDGLFSQLYKIIGIVLPLLEYFNKPELQKKVELSAEKMTTEIIHFLTDTFTNDIDFIKHALSYSLDNSNNIFFNKVFENVLKFILYHEFGHIYFQHFEFNPISQFKLNPATAKFINLYSDNKTFGWEKEADLFAILCLLSEYERFSEFNAFDPNFTDNTLRPDVAILSIYFYYELLQIVDVVAESLYDVNLEFDTHPQYKERIEFLKNFCLETNPNLIVITEILTQINKQLCFHIKKLVDK